MTQTRQGITKRPLATVLATVLAVLLASVLTLALVGCGGQSTSAPPAGSSGSAGTTVPPESGSGLVSGTSGSGQTEQQQPPMNDEAAIVSGIEVLAEPSYAFAGENAVHLKLPDGYKSEPYRGLSLTQPKDWDLGTLTIHLGANAEVNETSVDVRSENTVNNIAAALFATSVHGMSPSQGQQIADALHVGDLAFAQQYSKRIYALDYQGYHYFYEMGNFFRLTVTPDDTPLSAAQCVLFDLNGNELKPN